MAWSQRVSTIFHALQNSAQVHDVGYLKEVTFKHEAKCPRIIVTDISAETRQAM